MHPVNRTIKLDALKKDFEALVTEQRVKKFDITESNYSEGIYDGVVSLEHGKRFENTSVVQVQNSLQRDIRAMFGRENILNTYSIAEHPDFSHLTDDSSIKYQYTCPLFIDIIGSTRLSLVYDLDFIYLLKNVVIRTCIEVIRAFDGYVHRIMGDAVLGFFGSSTKTKKQAALDCINASTVLNLVLDRVIRPWISDQKVSFEDSKDFGFRIGCNFGDDENVLWGNYGFGNVGEISPTGFPIDLAAKLQGLANKNTIMMGQDILELLNFPTDFSKIKSKQKTIDSVITDIPVPYVVPNYTVEGEKLNYMMRYLNLDRYIIGLPLRTTVKKSICNNVTSNPSIILNVQVKRPGEGWIDFFTNNQIVLKDSSIKFSIIITHDTNLVAPLNIEFKKINQLGFNNEEKLLSENKHEEIESYTVDFGQNRIYKQHESTRTFERECKFSGIHQLECRVTNNNGAILFRDVINVPID